MPRGKKRSPFASAAGIVAIIMIMLVGSLLVVNYFYEGGFLGLMGYQAPLPPEDGVDVEWYTKSSTIRFAITDIYAGGAIASVTTEVYKGDIKYDSLTTTSTGLANTTYEYTSGEVIKVYLKKSSTAAKQWMEITVPKVRRAELEYEYIQINIGFWTYNAWTVTVMDSGGNSYTFATNNWTGSVGSTSDNIPDADQSTLVVNMYQGTDNRGFISSFDPLNNIDWYTGVYLKVNGTDYENIVVTGYDSAVEKGSAMYYFRKLGDVGLTRWKVGNTIKQEGSSSASFAIDVSGYNATSADFCIYVVSYTDWDYFTQYGSMGVSGDAVYLDNADAATTTKCYNFKMDVYN